MAIESLHALEKASENKDIFEVVLDSDCTDRGVHSRCITTAG